MFHSSALSYLLSFMAPPLFFFSPLTQSMQTYTFPCFIIPFKCIVLSQAFKTQWWNHKVETHKEQQALFAPNWNGGKEGGFAQCSRYCRIMPLHPGLCTNMFPFNWNNNHFIITKDNSRHQMKSMQKAGRLTEAKRGESTGDEAWCKSYGPWRRRKEELTLWLICYCLPIWPHSEIMGWELLTFVGTISQHHKLLNY